jgi:hypothetical protein
MKSKIIIALIIIFVIVYWRGTKEILAKAGMDCEWHAFYAICKSDKPQGRMPNFMDILKAGSKF